MEMLCAVCCVLCAATGHVVVCVCCYLGMLADIDIGYWTLMLMSGRHDEAQAQAPSPSP
jgi:hypothetical protein